MLHFKAFQNCPDFSGSSILSADNRKLLKTYSPFPTLLGQVPVDGQSNNGYHLSCTTAPLELKLKIIIFQNFSQKGFPFANLIDLIMKLKTMNSSFTCMMF